MKRNVNVNRRGNRFLWLLLSLVCLVRIHAQGEADSLNLRLDPEPFACPPSVAVRSVRMDTTFTNAIYREGMMRKPRRPINIYDMPYSVNAHYPNYKRLGINSGVLFGGGLMALGVLQLLPEESTAWNKKEITEVPLFKRWKNNVKKGPVWDNDSFVFNYILHPYGGAAYYMSARSQGFNLYYSALYCFCISTFFWEYGIEAFMEVPSIQDLFITPLAGTLFGEGFYLLKRHIVANQYRLFGSPVVGNIVAYIIDPVNEVIGIFAGNPCRSKNKSPDKSLVFSPQITPGIHGTHYGFAVRLWY